MNFGILWIALLLIVCLESSAFAYLDPGTGSMLWQAVAAITVAVAYATKLYWAKIKNSMQRLFKKGPPK